MHATLPYLENSDFPALNRRAPATLQVNLGYRCNQTCVHCHVNAGPNRTEVMDRETVGDLLAFMDAGEVQTLDVTGGAPELNPHFRELVAAARERGVHVIDRCNLTVLEEPDQDGLAEFLAENRVEVVASLPCYQEANVDSQRGQGVFDTSIRALRRLNDLGYGDGDAGHLLTLVYNPLGPSLPPEQGQLEAAYRTHLAEEFGVAFDRLFTIANMPIQRFGSTLISHNQFDDYLALLKGAHRDTNLEGVMCRDLLSVDWQGYVYDCDFNQMLDLPLAREGHPDRVHIRDLIGADLAGNPVVVRDHCYGCTAGQGSGCGGALG
ncbi:arsenosugar biosynthesis radical SAM (seleno)protein ArsS [Thiohalorhabdus methylotrophus]|uniref:Arsenosugar biosynthesis radical SAM (Seleno)protein ArsS n=1 Tax=Thiohalorhabdus methylotrophus TaxID=3242694 RepID=A0ABV4TSJ9_9GAMM